MHTCRQVTSTHPFAVDRHLLVRRDTKIPDFIDVPHLLHVRSIATSSENDTNFRARVNIVRGDKRSCRIIDECSKFDRDVLWREQGSGFARVGGMTTCLLCKRTSEHFSNVTTFGVGSTKALGPANESAMINSFLPGILECWHLSASRRTFDSLRRIRELTRTINSGS